MPRFPGNKLELGIVDGKGVPLEMTPRMRSTHLYICGATGTGKSKMLENLIRQDIKNWHKSKCGALIIDPHGSLYDSLVNWIAWNEKYVITASARLKVAFIPFDMMRREQSWTLLANGAGFSQTEAGSNAEKRLFKQIADDASMSLFSPPSENQETYP